MNMPCQALRVREFGAGAGFTCLFFKADRLANVRVLESKTAKPILQDVSVFE